MQVQVTFSVQGYVTQTVKITKPGYTPEQLKEDLNDGKVFTTIDKGGEVEIVESGEVVAIVTGVDNNLEYDDFDVE